MRDALLRLKKRMDQINAVYRDVKRGDRYSLTYQPGRGTELAFNGTPLVTLEGADSPQPTSGYGWAKNR